MTREDIECIIKWFSHIEQLATDGKTANGFQMPTDRLLATIKVVAKDSREYVEKFFNESIPNDLEEAAKRYIDKAWFFYYDENEIEQDVHDAFIAGAKWMAEQLKK